MNVQATAGNFKSPGQKPLQNRYLYFKMPLLLPWVLKTKDFVTFGIVNWSYPYDRCNNSYRI